MTFPHEYEYSHNPHDDCYWTCAECGNGILYSCACMSCWDSCEHDEPMEPKPDDELCRECHKEASKPTPPSTLAEQLGDITLLLMLMPAALLFM